MSDQPESARPAPIPEATGRSATPAPAPTNATSPGATSPGSTSSAATSSGATSAGGRRPPAQLAAQAKEPTRVLQRKSSPLGGIALFLAALEAVALGALWAHPRIPPALGDQLAHLQSEADQATADAQKALTASGEARDALTAQQSQLEAARRMIASVAGAAPAAPGGEKTAGAAPPSTSVDAAGLADQIASLRTAIEQAREESRAAIASLASAERADIASVRSAQTATADQLGAKVASLGARIDQQGEAGARAALLAARAERLARLQSAEVALGDGRPLGEIPNAPVAVTRFADSSPPTTASLVLSFPDAARAALRASEPDTSGQGFFNRLWTRAQAAVTVRDGNRVIVGDPAAGIISAARERLAAGDLAGVVATLGELSGPAADAMDPWRSRAASLVDARAALAQMMARG